MENLAWSKTVTQSFSLWPLYGFGVVFFSSFFSIILQRMKHEKLNDSSKEYGGQIKIIESLKTFPLILNITWIINGFFSSPFWHLLLLPPFGLFRLKVAIFLILSSIIICVIGTLMFAGTVYDILFLQWPRWRAEWRIEENKRTNIRSQDTDDEPLILERDIQLAPNPTGEPPPPPPPKKKKKKKKIPGKKCLNAII